MNLTKENCPFCEVTGGPHTDKCAEYLEETLANMTAGDLMAMLTKGEKPHCEYCKETDPWLLYQFVHMPQYTRCCHRCAERKGFIARKPMFFKDKNGETVEAFGGCYAEKD
jgi:hypothetical protein